MKKLLLLLIPEMILASLISFMFLILTINVPVYSQDDQVKTIGITTWSGLPIPFKMSAPGLSWSEFSGIRFAGSFLIIFFISWAVINRIRLKYKQNKENKINSTD